MRAQMRGALGQQHRHSLGTVDQRHQHRGRAQRGARRGHAGIEVVVAAQRAAERRRLHRVGAAAKAAPARLPSCASRSITPSRASLKGARSRSPIPSVSVCAGLTVVIPSPARIAELEEHAVAPYPELRSRRRPSPRAEIDQLVEHRPRQPRLEPRPHQDIGRRLAVRGGLDAQRMLGPGRHNLVQIGAEDQAAGRGPRLRRSTATAMNGDVLDRRPGRARPG